MAYGTTLLLQPLYDVQRAMAAIEAKYENVYANVLGDLDEQTKKQLQDANAVPHNALSNFMYSTVSALTSYSNNTKIINGERVASTNMATTYYILFLCLVIASITIWFVLYFGPQFKAATSTICRIEMCYFAVLAVAIFIFAVYISTTFYRKNTNIYEHIYKADFNDIADDGDKQYIMSIVELLRVVDPGSSDDDPAKVQTSSPIYAYYYARDRGFNVKIDKLIDRKFAGSNVKQTGCITSGANMQGCNNINLKKTKLTDVLNNCTPCNTYADNGLMYLDPFTKSHGTTLDKQHEVINSKILLKKLQKYDFYDQLSRLSNAILYFKGFMLKKYDSSGSALNDNDKTNLITSISDVLKIKFQVFDDLQSIKTDKDKMFLWQNNTLKEIYNVTDCFTSCLNNASTCSSAYFNDKTNTCYHFNKSSTDPPSFLYTNNNGTGQYVLMIRDDKQHLQVYCDKYPQAETIQALFSNITSEIYPEYSSKKDSLYRMHKNSDSKTEYVSSTDVDYTKLFKDRRSTDTYNENNTDLTVYDTFVNATIDTKTSTQQKLSLVMMRTYLIDTIINKIVDADPNSSFEFTTVVSGKVIDNIKTFYGNNWSSVASVVQDILAQIPAELLKLRTNQHMGTKGNVDFISYERFATKLSTMTHDDFMNKFLANTETLRHTTSGLKIMYDKFNYADDAVTANNKMLNVTFYFVVCVGCTEVLRFAMNKWAEVKHAWDHPSPENVEKKKKVHTRDTQTAEIVRHFVGGLSSIVFVIVFYLIVVALLYTWKERTASIYDFNKMILHKNARTLVNLSDNNFALLMDAIVKDKQFITYTGGDSILQEDKDAMYIKLMESSQNLKDKTVIMSKTNDYSELYNSLVDICNYYDKSNEVFNGSTNGVPFPYFELSLYIMMVIILIVALSLVVFKMDPFNKIETLKLHMRMKKRLERAPHSVDLSELQLTCEPTANDDMVDSYIRLMAVVLILVFTILFAATLITNNRSFKDSLYASDLFKNSETYKM